MRFRPIVLLLVLPVLSLACVANSPPPATPVPTSAPGPSVPEAPLPLAGDAAAATPSAGLEALLVADLAARLGVAPSSIQVLTFEARSWPNGCLGLGEGGQVCSQAFVSGWLATLRAVGGTEHRYRGAGSRFVPEP